MHYDHQKYFLIDIQARHMADITRANQEKDSLRR